LVVVPASAPLRIFTGEIGNYAFFETITNTFAKADSSCPDAVRSAFASVSQLSNTSGNPNRVHILRISE
jgi:hypothetical protein